jgi:hypothetical protein
LSEGGSQALANSDSFGILYSEGVRRLRGLCRKTNLVPTSCRVSQDIIETTTDPIRSHFSDVYTGVLDGRKVAIKVLRVHRDQLDDVRKVRSVARECSLKTHSHKENRRTLTS